jgi:hypothetical protein
VKITARTLPTHNPWGEAYWASGLRENLTSRSYGEGLETGRIVVQVPRQSLTRQRVFQQITEVFHLQTLIGTTPQGTVFQFAFCVLLYNMVQVVRAYVATAQARPVPTISTELLFDDVHRQLVALTELVPAERIEFVAPVLPTEEALRAQLTRLLATTWTNRWLKQPAKKRTAPAPRTPIRGNHTSVFRLVARYHNQRVKCSSQ